VLVALASLVALVVGLLVLVALASLVALAVGLLVLVALASLVELAVELLVLVGLATLVALGEGVAVIVALFVSLFPPCRSRATKASHANSSLASTAGACASSAAWMPASWRLVASAERGKGAFSTAAEATMVAAAATSSSHAAARAARMVKKRSLLPACRTHAGRGGRLIVRPSTRTEGHESASWARARS
jgi:hypothetical protein